MKRLLIIGGVISLLGGTAHAADQQYQPLEQTLINQVHSCEAVANAKLAALGEQLEAVKAERDKQKAELDKLKAPVTDTEKK